jgi:hypothetical protein
MTVTLAERLREWSGSRVSVMFANDETQVGDLLEVGEDYLILLAGSLQYLIGLRSVVRVNQIREQ